MSWDCTLVDPITKKPLHAETAHHMTGGTFAVGGTTELTLNVTYNYCPTYYEVMPGGLRDSLDGKSAIDTLPVLQAAVDKLSDEGGEANYWEPTPGNAKRALLQLIALVKLAPHGVWEVS